MKYFEITILAISWIIILGGGCNTTDKGESATVIKPGNYSLQAQRTIVNDYVFSSGPEGQGYYSERFRFFEEDSLQIEINSDIVSESGLAKAQYQIEGSRLSTTIKFSTTSRYKSGETITFTKVSFVEESYSETLESNGDSYTFQGPGLILEQEYEDRQDLDDDGDTSEMVIKTKFYHRMVRYDDGGM